MHTRGFQNVMISISCCIWEITFTKRPIRRLPDRHPAQTSAARSIRCTNVKHFQIIEPVMRNIAVIRCYSPTRETRESFCAEMTERTGLSLRAVATPEEAVRGADIVLCATNASQPVFKAEWLERGMHVGTIRGAELEPDVVRRADVIAVHDRSVRAMMSVTRGIEMPKTRHAIPGVDDLIAKAPTLGELIAGMAQSRRAADQTSCFLNLSGIGLQFAAVGAAFYRKAREAGRGRELPTEWFTEDVLP